MKKYHFLYTSLVLVALLWVLNYVALSLHLYWTLWWLDNVAHFLGGFSLGFFALYIFHESGLFGDSLSFSRVIFLSFIFVMILSGAWEIFEYVNGITQSTEKYSLDVVHDLLSDTLGVILALLITKRFLKSS